MTEKKKKNRKKKIISMGIAVFILGGTLTACGKKSSQDEYIPIVRDAYEKEIYQTVQVEQGTIKPELMLKLKPDEYEVISYSIDKELLEVDEMYVEMGSRVNAGDVMVVFKNDGIEDEISDYQNRRDEATLLLTHYEKLQEIDPDTDYSEEIKSIKADISVTDAYIAEAEAKLADYQLVAERSGVVTRVSKDLINGYANGKSVLLQVTSGSSNYVAVTSDEYEFEIGAEYEATSGVASYTLKLIAIDEASGGRQLTFEPVSDMSSVSETSDLNMTIQKPIIENAVYVDKNAIELIDDTTYVFTLDEQGYRHAVEVEVENIIDDYAILTNSVEVGEQVIIQ